MAVRTPRADTNCLTCGHTVSCMELPTCESAGSIWIGKEIKLHPEESRVSYYLETFGHCYFHCAQKWWNEGPGPTVFLQSIYLLDFNPFGQACPFSHTLLYVSHHVLDKRHV